MQDLWFLRDDAEISYKLDRLLLRNAKLGVRNSMEVGIAEDQLRDKTNVLTSDDVPLPVGFPAPQLGLPARGFAPDYFTLGSHCFCSRRFREALAQPEHVVQFAAVELVAGGADASAQDYRLLRVLAQQPVMDLERSECELEDFVNRLTGERKKEPRFIERFVFINGLQPQTGIFRIEESPTDILVADSVAERVLRVGCTGMEFADPANLQHGMRVERYRTLDGVADRRVHFLD